MGVLPTSGTTHKQVQQAPIQGCSPQKGVGGDRGVNISGRGICIKLVRIFLQVSVFIAVNHSFGGSSP